MVEQNTDEYVQIFSGYDKSMIDWLGLIKYRDRSIIRVFATPERAFNQYEKQIARKRKRPVDRTQKVAPKPFCSVHRPSEAPIDPQRFNPIQLRRLFYEAANEKYYGMRFPLPVKITYQVDFWARNISDMDHFSNQWKLSLDAGDYFYMSVEHPFPMETRNVFTQASDLKDLSSLESETDDRMLRREVTLTAFGWLIYPANRYGIVKHQIIKLCESEGLETCEDLLATIDIIADEDAAPYA